MEFQNQPSPESNIITPDELMREAEQPSRPALADVAPPDGESQSGFHPFQFTPPPAEDGAAPLFAEPEPAPEPARPLSKKAAGMPVDLFLKLRNKLQSRLLAKIARSKDPSRYEYTDDDLDMLTEAYMPIAQRYGGEIPEGLVVLAVEAITTGSLFVRAFEERRANTVNIEAAKSPVFAEKVNAALQKPVERTRWSIDERGFYLYPPKSPKRLKEADRTEKAIFRDVENLIEVNGFDMVRRAFPEWDLSRFVNGNATAANA